MTTAAGELFRSDDLRVSLCAPHGSHCCVVTFDSFNETGTLDRLGYGQAFLDASGIDAVHVVSRGNDWYQYPQMWAAMAAVRTETQRHGRVIAYGSSMGGYAAIRLAGLAGADAVFALSPQFSIDPRVVPWERRWPESSRHFKDVWESELPWPEVAEAFVVHDPRTPDNRHVSLLQHRFAFCSIALPGAGHPVTGFLAEIGLLQTAIMAICEDSFDAAGFVRSAHDLRTRSAQYLLGRAGSRWRLSRSSRIELMRDALRLVPDNAMAACRLGQELARARCFEEAIKMHRRAMEIAPGNPYFVWAGSFCLEASGQTATALALMEELPLGALAQTRYRVRLEQLRARIRARGSGRG